MNNDLLRILIAEPRPTRRRSLEKLLNAEGLYGIATARSDEELMKLAGVGFDLILIEHAMAGSEHSAVSRKLLNGSRRRHMLRYRSDDREPGAVEAKQYGNSLLLSMPGCPDAPLLRQLIRHVRAGLPEHAED